MTRLVRPIVLIIAPPLALTLISVALAQDYICVRTGGQAGAFAMACSAAPNAITPAPSTAAGTGAGR